MKDSGRLPEPLRSRRLTETASIESPALTTYIALSDYRFSDISINRITDLPSTGPSRLSASPGTRQLPETVVLGSGPGLETPARSTSKLRNLPDAPVPASDLPPMAAETLRDAPRTCFPTPLFGCRAAGALDAREDLRLMNPASQAWSGSFYTGSPACEHYPRCEPDPPFCLAALSVERLFRIPIYRVIDLPI